MALDHSRLGVEKKLLENKLGRIFAKLENLANKSGCLLYFLYITSEVKEYYEALFLSYRPPDLRQLAVSFTIFQDKKRDYREKSEKHLFSLLAFLNNWLNFRVRGQFGIKMLIVLGHSDINTTYFI